ncbi:MAG: HEPN domain-containing protein [Oligoflexia bacterium]|nr:HEPN domain-containing protein [Oligoflexia bacterium]
MGRLKRYEAWILQAINDLKWAEDSLKSGHFAQTCFISQQIGEKAIKALAFFRGNDLVKSHSIFKIAEALHINSEIAVIAKKLDRYYITTRYPDAIPDSGVPYEYFDISDAEEALQFSKHILDFVKKELGMIS